MSRNPGRPLSPHLTIWKWGPHMLVSILHRATGVALAIGAGLMLIWWLVALASGPDAYGRYVNLMTADGSGRLNLIPALIALGLSWSFFQHAASGVRHLLLDTGAGYELRTNKRGAMATMAASVVLTLAFWALILGRY